jgi:hypothetical protein
MTAEDVVVHTVPAIWVDIIADSYGTASVVVDGQAFCVVANEATGAVVRFESPRVPQQRIPAGEECPKCGRDHWGRCPA